MYLTKILLALSFFLFHHAFAETNFGSKSQCLPISPTFFAGKAIKKNNEWTHYLRWGPAADPNVIEYQISQNNALIRTIEAKGPFEVILPNRSSQENTDYQLIALTSDGTKCCPLSIILGPCQRQAYTPCCKCKPILISPQIVNPTQKANGKILINASGGTAPYRYSIDGGATYQKSNLFFGLPAGTYTLAVKDKNGCKSTAYVTLKAAACNLPFTTSLVNPCMNKSNGSITVNVTGGTPSYFFYLDGTFIAEGLSPFTYPFGLTSGTYLVTVKDSKGCSGSESVPLSALTITDVSQPSCNQITVTVAGGNPTYLFALSGTNHAYGFGSSTTTITFSGISNDTYIVSVSDITNCGAKWPTQITVSCP